MNTELVLLGDRGPLERIRALVLDSVSSPNSKRAYGAAVDQFLSWCRQEQPGGFTKALVQRYRGELEGRGLAPATINIHLSAIRRLALEAADNGLMDPELAAGISRVKGVKRLGVRVGNWLTREQAEQLLAAPEAGTLKGKRDRALLAVLIGCGLRRDEAAELRWQHIQQREGRWVIVDLVGKGGRIRTVPMPSWAKAVIDDWHNALVGIAGGDDQGLPMVAETVSAVAQDRTAAVEGGLSPGAPAAPGQGRVFRALGRSGRVSESMTAQSIYEAVQVYCRRLGLPAIAPHDLRRTFAKLAHKGRAALEQIQLSLGHASIQTTERYLGVRQDLTDAPCDRLGISIG